VAAAAWGGGDFSVSVADASEDELGQLGRRLDRMAEQLADLIRTREHLSVFDERNRLARDLHDSVKQQAFAVSMHLGSARARWEHDPVAARQQLEAAYEIARRSQQELSAIIQTLRPIALNDTTVDQAIGEHVASWQALTGIVAQAQVSGDMRLPPAVEDALFRVTEEALANVARHSSASRVRVTLAGDANAAQLEIVDDGKGFEIRRTRPGIGLQSMRERVEALGGTMTVESGAKGTRLSLRVPLAERG
jgi:NarL family two-component system sensor histidine kinase LiaS